MAKCPYCGRLLTKHERFCYHCEQDVGKAVDESERPHMPRPKPYDLKKDVQEFKKTFSSLFRKPVKAYCVKCRKKVDVRDPTHYKMKNGTPSIKGSCPHCGTKVFRIISKTTSP